MTDAEVIDAIRRNHLRANISNPHLTRHYWAEARLDPGGTIFGPGPYMKLPVDEGSDDTRVTIRVYPPARLRRQLAARWQRR